MLPDERFELPTEWRGAEFRPLDVAGSVMARQHPRGEFVVRSVHGRKYKTAVGVWEASTGALVELLPDALDAGWTPDGEHLVVVDEALTATVLEWPDLATRCQASLGFSTESGVGGLELVISGSGCLGAVLVYSGQSEVGYVLFSLPDVETLARLPYVCAESASGCVFSPDGRYLVAVVEPSRLWWTDDDERSDTETPAKGGPVHWATIHAQETRPHGVHAEHPILVDVPRGWRPRGNLEFATWPRNVRFAAGDHLSFDVPWGGTCSVRFPPSGRIFAPPPRMLRGATDDS